MRLVRKCLLGLLVTMLHPAFLTPAKADVFDDETYAKAMRDGEHYWHGPDGACWLTVGGQQTCILSWVARPDVLRRTWTLTSGSVRSLAGTYIGKTSVGDWIVVKVVGTENGKTGAKTFKKLARQCLSGDDINYLETATLRAADGTPALPFDGTAVAPLPTGKTEPHGIVYLDQKSASPPPLPPGLTPVAEPWEDFTPVAPAGLSDAERDNWTQAVQGNAQAQNYVGWMFETGKGVPQNYTDAAKWYRRAAEQGNAEAQNRLGCLYWNGNGTPKNAVEAGQWWQKAAAQGNAAAKENLALLSKDTAALVVGYIIIGGIVLTLVLLPYLLRNARAQPKPHPQQPATPQPIGTAGAPRPVSVPPEPLNAAVAATPARGVEQARQRSVSATGSQLKARKAPVPRLYAAGKGMPAIPPPPQPVVKSRPLRTTGLVLLLYAGLCVVLVSLGGWDLFLKALCLIPCFVLYGLFNWYRDKQNDRAVKRAIPTHTDSIPAPTVPPSLRNHEKWFFAIGADREGPVSRESLLALRVAGKLNDEALVWSAGFDTWKPFKQVMEETPPSVPPPVLAEPAMPSTAVPHGAVPNAGTASPLTMPTQLPPQQRTGRRGTGITSLLYRLPPGVRNFVVSIIGIVVVFGAINLLSIGGHRIWHHNDQEKLDGLKSQIDLMKQDLGRQEAQMKGLDAQISRSQEAIDRTKPILQRYENSYPDGIPEDQYGQYCRELGQYNGWVQNKNVLVAQYNAIYQDYGGRVDRCNAAITEANATAKEIGGPWYVIPIPLPAVGGRQPTEMRQRSKVR